jgi:hypothetical protein
METFYVNGYTINFATGENWIDVTTFGQTGKTYVNSYTGATQTTGIWDSKVPEHPICRCRIAPELPKKPEVITEPAARMLELDCEGWE